MMGRTGKLEVLICDVAPADLSKDGMVWPEATSLSSAIEGCLVKREL